MRRLLVVGLVALGVAGVVATPAIAQCPVCEPPHANCLGAPSSNYILCVQYEWGCRLFPGECNESFALNAPQVAPDGSVAVAPPYGLRSVAFEDYPGHVAAQYSVVGCQSYVVSRRYEAGEAAARRERTAVILM